MGYDPWNLPVTWKEGGSTQFKFDTQIAQLKSRETTVAAKVSVGAENIDMGGNSSFSYEVQHGSTKTESIGFSLNYPPARKDHAEDIVRVKLRICIFTPKETPFRPVIGFQKTSRPNVRGASRGRWMRYRRTHNVRRN